MLRDQTSHKVASDAKVESFYVELRRLRFRLAFSCKKTGLAHPHLQIISMELDSGEVLTITSTLTK